MDIDRGKREAKDPKASDFPKIEKTAM